MQIPFNDQHAETIQKVLNTYGLSIADCTVEPLGEGLINRTWMVSHLANRYVLQKINTAVFAQPECIDKNLRLIGDYLDEHAPEYKLTLPLQNLHGESLVFENNSYYRLFDFVKGSQTVLVVDTPERAFQAAQAFSEFSAKLQYFPVANLCITIKDFHNLQLRWQQYGKALQNPVVERYDQGRHWLNTINSYYHIVSDYDKFRQDQTLKLRTMHHDTKISNVLFDEAGRSMGVIDLDTVMPGYFISDVGDMMRTYLTPVSEECKDFKEIAIREDVFVAIVEGYKSHMAAVLTKEESSLFYYAATFMVYMQALRFFTDFLTGDQYYGSHYEGHNLVRAGNQLTLLERIVEKENELKALAEKH